MSRNPAAFFTLLVILTAALLVGLTALNFQVPPPPPAQNSFSAYWTAADLWLTEGFSPYEERVRREAEDSLYGRAAVPNLAEGTGHFLAPMYAMVFYGPLGLLEFEFARAIWMTLLEVSLLGAVFLGFRLVNWRPSPLLTGFVLLFSLFWYHGVRSVLAGEPTALVLLLVVVALFLIRQRQDTAAGAVLAISTFQPQAVLLLVPFVLVWAYSGRRMQVLAGFFIALAALIVVSLMVVPSWPLQMVAVLLDYQERTVILSPLARLAGFAPGIEQLLNRLLPTLAVLYMVTQWALAWKKDERWLVWTGLMTLVITRLVLPTASTGSYIILLPALLLAFRVAQQRFGAAGTVLIVLLLGSTGAGLWLLPNTSRIESAVHMLLVPLISLVLLWWSRWWAVRRQRLLLEEVADRFGY